MEAIWVKTSGGVMNLDSGMQLYATVWNPVLIRPNTQCEFVMVIMSYSLFNHPFIVVTCTIYVLYTN